MRSTTVCDPFVLLGRTRSPPISSLFFSLFACSHDSSFRNMSSDSDKLVISQEEEEEEEEKIEDESLVQAAEGENSSVKEQHKDKSYNDKHKNKHRGKADRKSSSGVAKTQQQKRSKKHEHDEDEEYVPSAKQQKMVTNRKRKCPEPTSVKGKKEEGSPAACSVRSKLTSQSQQEHKKNDKEGQDVWKSEEKFPGGQRKWQYLEHKGPVFPAAYELLPESVNFFYDGIAMKLSQDAEEVATLYGQTRYQDFTKKDVFNKNFFQDWRKCMTEKERSVITDFTKCDFEQINNYFKVKSEQVKHLSEVEKQIIKENNEKMQKEYGHCVIDGYSEKIANFKIESPGLFYGRRGHSKIMGMVKRRVMPEDIIINCSKDSKHPVPPEGHRWKEVKHDSNVAWLACWVDNVQNQTKYVVPTNLSSKLKGEKDWQRYETARKLKKNIDDIRKTYMADWKSKLTQTRQRAVALYFIDKLALRAGNEKDEEKAYTVGCESLQVKHISLHEEKDGKKYVVILDFLGKDSFHYHNAVPVEKPVFKSLKHFMKNKQPHHYLFDWMTTAVLTKYMNVLMEGLTAKVFRTYNASNTLQNQLTKWTDRNATVAEKILSYNRANRAVVTNCHLQRAVTKAQAESMENLKKKVEDVKEEIKAAERELKGTSSQRTKMDMEKKQKALERLMGQYSALQGTDQYGNREMPLAIFTLNCLDPRISIAWCKKNEVPIDKIYNKKQRAKFCWAITTTGADYKF